VIIGILAVCLDQEMIDIGDHRLGAYLLDAHSLELKSPQRTGPVVQQKLIDL